MINALSERKAKPVGINNIFNGKTLILDGGMGTMIQSRGYKENTHLLGITNPDVLTDIHRMYVESGSDMICANTFGVSRIKLCDSGYTVEEVIEASVKAAKKACNENTKVILDVSSLGVMLEPNGTMTFEEAYDCYAEIAKAGEKAGADLVKIATMTDLYEAKAAVLAMKENCNLPVFVSMSFESGGRTFTGCEVECYAATMEGLGVDALGINCSLGPNEIYPIAERLCRATTLPVFVKPNAGLPDPKTNAYSMNAEDFCAQMEQYKKLGLCAVGGCCGTTPEFIKKLSESYKDSEITERSKKNTEVLVCSQTRYVTPDHVAVIGERINPTGKKRFRQALAERDFDYILAQAIAQTDAGAEILDVNVGAPGIDEVSLLPELVKRLQAVTDAPLQIDSSNPQAVEAALRVYCGKAIVNSVNGGEQSLSAVLPIVKKYGACVVGLTLDESGIPETAEGRVAIAQRIADRASELDIEKKDIIIDCLTMAVSAQPGSANITLEALKRVKEMGFKTVLGVSNISFGLPNRGMINRTFLTLALEAGLDLPIINPNDADMSGTVLAFNLLKGMDENAQNYITHIAEPEKETMQVTNTVNYYIKKGLKKETADATVALLEKHGEMEIVNDYLIPALDEVGKEYENKKLFLPQLLNAAAAAQCAFDVIRDRLASSGKTDEPKGKIVIATVHGDIHDIGKNIVKTVLANYGYAMTDLGRDVPVEAVVEAVKADESIKLVGLSALMTTTLPAMEETVKAVKAVRPECKIMVGGAVLTEEYAMSIGADFYCADAMQAVAAARKVYG